MSSVFENGVTPEQVTRLALELSPHEQALLLARLHNNLASLGKDPEHEGAWASEIERRVREIENGVAELIDHEDVMREAREMLAKR
jgi:putative addiction module component (TIGR02574 family)